MDAIQEKVTAFTQQWQDYCLPDKHDLIKLQINQFCEAIDKLTNDNSKIKFTSDDNKKEKAKLYYLKGRILDLLPSYQKLSEDLLTKSVKLNPANGDCWNCLAHVLFKKGDYLGASKAIQMAIQSKGKNKVSLRYQSVLLRAQGKLPEQKRKNIEQSLKLIKQALILDLKDWLTWYFLGNAYFSNFIANCKKIQQLENAQKAYNQSQKYLKIKYPDLNLNRANVEAHLQEYDKAIKDLLIADQLDPSLGAKTQIQKIRNRMQFTKTSFQRANEMKKAKIEQIVKTIPNSINKGNANQQSKVQIVPIKSLKQKQNVNKMLSTKILGKLTNQQDIPASFLAIDSEGNFLCVSIYNVKTETIDQKIKKDTLLTLRDPYIKHVTFENFSYYSAQVFDFTKIYADKKSFTYQDFNPNTVYNETFQK